jgi:hypothetical protein
LKTKNNVETGTKWGDAFAEFFLDLKNAERICGIKKEIKKYKIKRLQITHLSSQYTNNIGAL